MRDDLHTFGVQQATSHIDAINVTDDPAEHRTPTAFLDLMVDDQPLRALLTSPEELSPVENETTAFRDDWIPEAALEQIDRLLVVLPSDFEDGRVAIFLCPVDGDTWCGTISVEITRAAGTVTWGKFGWQYPDGYVEQELELFSDQLFVFDQDQYEQVLRDLRDYYARQPTQEPQIGRTAEPDTLWSTLRCLLNPFGRR